MRAIFMKFSLLLAPLAFAVLTTSAMGAGAYDCRVYEYAELKDMETSALLSKAVFYHDQAESLEKSVNLTERFGYHQLGPKVAQDEKDSLDRCRGETQRLVVMLRKRKDVARAVKSYEPPFYAQFAGKFGFPRAK